MDKYYSIVTDIPPKYKQAYKACTGAELNLAYVVTKCESRKQADAVCAYVGLDVHYHPEYSNRVYDTSEQQLCDTDSNGIIIANYLGRMKKEHIVCLDQLRDYLMRSRK